MKLSDLPPGRFRDAAMNVIGSDTGQDASGVVRVYLPIRTVSEANCRDHWAVKARRVKAHRQNARCAIESAKGINSLLTPEKTLAVAMVRIRSMRARKLDNDNLRSSLKAVRDGIAQALGIDDGSDRIVWTYAQDQAKDYGVRIEISPAPAV